MRGSKDSNVSFSHFFPLPPHLTIMSCRKQRSEAKCLNLVHDQALGAKAWPLIAGFNQVCLTDAHEVCLGFATGTLCNVMFWPVWVLFV